MNPRSAAASKPLAMLQSCQRDSPVGEPGPVPFWGVSQQLDITQAPPPAVLEPPAPAGTRKILLFPPVGRMGRAHLTAAVHGLLLYWER